MAEVLGIVSAVLGLLPIAAEVVKGFHTLCRVAEVAKSCAKELEDIHVALQVQERRFLNECELILQMISSDQKIAREMTDNPDNPLWDDSTLEIRIQSCMSGSYEQFFGLIKAMRETQGLLEKKLSIFDSIRKEKQKHEPLRSAFKRLRIQFGFNVDSYQQKLSKIRCYNYEITGLRSQLKDLRKTRQSHVTTLPLPGLTSLPNWISSAREIFRDAYETLNMAFSCQDDKHTDHYAALETGVRGGGRQETRLEFAIVHRQGTKYDHRDPQVHQLADLVDSCEKQTFLGLILHTCHPQLEWTRDTTHNLETPKRIRLTESEPDNDQRTSNIPNDASLVSLSSIDNACAYLLHSPRNNTALANLHENPPCQHSFYISKSNISHLRDPHHQKESLQTLFKSCSAEMILLSDRFKLAIQLVYAVLQDHSTPWLRNSWNTSDLFFEQLSPNQQGLNLVLFLRSRFIGRGNTELPHKGGSLVPEDKGKSRANPEGAYNISNRTLFSLGIVLLEIGHWAPISQMRLDGERDEIATALRVAQERATFGRRYGDIVRRCMQCQFGYGKDLSKPELQSAVYSSVVWPLQELVNSLDGL